MNNKEEVQDIFNNMVLVYLAGHYGFKHGEDIPNDKIEPEVVLKAKDFVKGFLKI